MNILPENSAIFKVEKNSLSDEAVSYLDHYIREDHIVFQWGTGPSTFWLADRAAKVYSVSHCNKKFHYYNFYKDSNYYDNVTLKLCYPDKVTDFNYVSKNPEFTESSFKNFCNTIEDYPSKLFDIVVIEGGCKSKCLDLAIKNGKSKSMIVIEADDEYLTDYSKDIFYDIEHLSNIESTTTHILTLN